MRAPAGIVLATAGVLVSAGCGSSHTAAPTTAPTTTTSSPVTLASPQAQQVALARRSDGLFSIFPARPGTKRCTIPGGGLRTTPLRGTCTTRIRAAGTHEPALLVSFTETWGPPPCPPGARCPYLVPQHHTWTVVETEPIGTATAHLRIAATRQSGPTAPQFYK